MRPGALADEALHIIVTHPLGVIVVAFAAGILSWLMTRADSAA
jgi:hypothetical protein